MCTKTTKLLSDISCGWYINYKENFKIKAENTLMLRTLFFLTLMHTRNIVVIDILAFVPTVASRLVSLFRRKWCQVLVAR
jgi:hypothetical protein